jgi:homoserine dehydrogenase
MTVSRIRIALAGLGTVGTAVARLLEEDRERLREEVGVRLDLSLILDRSYRHKDIRWVSPDVRVTDALDELLHHPADIVVELIGGTEPAEQIITTALRQGKAVVTANKFLLAQSVHHYIHLAVQHHAYLGFEAAVAGGIPIIRALRHSLCADRIVRLRGILNGTCNFILSEMADHRRSYADVLAEAQRRGFAESDPTLDISGRDTADKLALLGTLAFGRIITPLQIPTAGITELDPVDFLYARRLDCAIKLLGVAQHYNGLLALRVSPFLVPRRLTLAAVAGALNAVEVTGARLGPVLFSGFGAGANPTAVSVVADIVNAALWKQGKGLFHPPRAEARPEQTALAADESYPFYIRFTVADRPGIIAAVASILASRKISLDAVIQEPWQDRTNLPFVVTVEPTPFSIMERALSELRTLEFNTRPPLLLPILWE